MAKFTKDILRPGRFYARNLESGERVRTSFSKDDLKRYAADFKRMKDAGLKMPAPYDHDGSTPLKDLSSAKNNAGYWDEIWFDEGSNTLKGLLVVENDDEVKKIGKTVQEVSPGISTWMDGDGTTWENTFNHVALVTRPVMQRQSNFVPVSQLSEGKVLVERPAPDGKKDANGHPVIERLGAVALSLFSFDGKPITKPVKAKGMSLQEDVTNNLQAAGKTNNQPPATDPQSIQRESMKRVLQILNSAGISLAPDTTPDNLVERLELVGGALLDNGVLTNPAVGREHQSFTGSGVALSIDNPNPVVKFAVLQTAEHYRNRIQGLIDSGRCTVDYANKALLPLTQSITLSIGDDGKRKEDSPLDIVLSALERQPEFCALTGEQRKAKKGQPSKLVFNIVGAEEHQIPDDFTKAAGDPAAMSADEVNATVRQLFKATGGHEFDTAATG